MATAPSKYVNSPTRMCVVCGKEVPSDKYKRGDSLPECKSTIHGEEYSPCTFDLTPEEAVDYWRNRYHDLSNAPPTLTKCWGDLRRIASLGHSESQRLFDIANELVDIHQRQSSNTK